MDATSQATSENARRESAATKVTLAIRKAHSSAASSQAGYSETSEAVSLGFTWLTCADTWVISSWFSTKGIISTGKATLA